MGFKLHKMDQFFFIQLYTKQNRSGNDKFKATKKYTRKILCSYSKINLGDS